MTDPRKLADKIAPIVERGEFLMVSPSDAKTVLAALRASGGGEAPQQSVVSRLDRELLQEAYALFSVDDYDVGTDEWAWLERTRWHVNGLCPRPIDDDDGTQKVCIANGHCGCVYGSGSYVDSESK